VAIEVEALLLRIEADTTRLGEELRRADSLTQRSTRAQSRAWDRVDARVQRFSRGLARLRVAIFSVAGPAALGVLSRDALAYAETLADTAQKLQLSTEALQEYRAAFAEVGVSQQAVDTGLQRFIRRLGEAQQGQGGLLKVLQQYGIALRESDGSLRDAEGVLEDYADAIAAAGSQQERLRLAFQAFDTEGVAMVSLLGQGAGALREFRAEARASGLVIESDLIARANEAEAQFARLGHMVRTQFRAGIMDGLVNGLGEVGDLVKDPELHRAVRDLGRGLTTIGTSAVAAFKQVAAFARAVGESVAEARAATAGAAQSAAIGVTAAGRADLPPSAGGDPTARRFLVGGEPTSTRPTAPLEILDRAVQKLAEYNVAQEIAAHNAGELAFAARKTAVALDGAGGGGAPSLSRAATAAGDSAAAAGDSAKEAAARISQFVAVQRQAAAALQREREIVAGALTARARHRDAIAAGAAALGGEVDATRAVGAAQQAQIRALGGTATARRQSQTALERHRDALEAHAAAAAIGIDPTQALTAAEQAQLAVIEDSIAARREAARRLESQTALDRHRDSVEANTTALSLGIDTTQALTAAEQAQLRTIEAAIVARNEASRQLEAQIAVEDRAAAAARERSRALEQAAERALAVERRAAEERAALLRAPIDEAARGIQGALAATFEKFYTGQTTAWAAFWNELQSVAMRTLAEITAASVTRGLFGGAGNAAGALTGGGLDLGDLLGAGRSLLSGAQSLLGFGGASAGAAGALTTSQALALAGPLGGAYAAPAAAAAVSGAAAAPVAGAAAAPVAGGLGALGGLAGVAATAAPIVGIGLTAASLLGFSPFAGREPSDRTQIGTIDLETGERSVGGLGGQKFSSENRDIAKAAIEFVAALRRQTKNIGGLGEGRLEIQIGDRDGFRVAVGNEQIANVRSVEQLRRAIENHFSGPIAKAAAAIERDLEQRAAAEQAAANKIERRDLREQARTLTRSRRQIRERLAGAHAAIGDALTRSATELNAALAEFGAEQPDAAALNLPDLGVEQPDAAALNLPDLGVDRVALDAELERARNALGDAFAAARSTLGRERKRETRDAVRSFNAALDRFRAARGRDQQQQLETVDEAFDDALRTFRGALGAGPLRRLGGALGGKFAATRKALSDELERIQSDAAAALSDELERIRADFDSQIGAFRAALGSEQIERFAADLALSPISPGTPIERTARARETFADLSRRAEGGETGIAGELTSAGQTLLALSRESYASGAQFQSDFSAVSSTLSRVLDAQAAAEASMEAALRDEMRAQTAAVTLANREEIRAQTAEVTQVNREEMRELRRELREQSKLIEKTNRRLERLRG